MESAPARAQSHIPPFVPTHTMLRAALKLGDDDLKEVVEEVPTHIMPRAALKLESISFRMPLFRVPTHTMLRAALKLPFAIQHADFVVSRHT